jgi:peroxiredoxin
LVEETQMATSATQLANPIASDLAARLHAGDLAPDAVVADAQGAPVHLASLWAEGPVLLAFLRHFGCIFCRERLCQLEKASAGFTTAGLPITALALGEPRHARRYGPLLAPSIRCLAAPADAVYTEYGITNMAESGMNVVKMLGAATRAALSGNMQGRTTGNRHFLGATFVIERGGRVRWAHFDSFPGDHGDLAAALAAWQAPAA